MNSKAATISAYVGGSIVSVILLNAIVKQLNSGIGFLTTNRKMARICLTSPIATEEPTTKEEWQQHYAWWNKQSKEFRRNWYKAVWQTQHGKYQEYFTADGKKYWREGGGEVKTKK